MCNYFLKIAIVISVFISTQVCFAEVAGVSNTSAAKLNTLKTNAENNAKLPERIITNEAEYAEMVQDYERKRAQSSIKSNTSAKIRFAVSSSSSSSSIKPNH
jgi:hypothetical protein